MIPEQSVLDLIAQHVIETWLLMMGIVPSTGWNSNDPNCVRDDGPHRIYTVCGKIPSDMADSLDIDALKISFENYIANHNKAITAIKFQPYDVQVYHCPCGCGTFLYVSIFN